VLQSLHAQGNEALITEEPIAIAPRDGQILEAFLAHEGIWAEIYWAQQTQAWVKVGDPERRTLQGVTHWRLPAE
jgi:hypothetical protein